MANKKDNYVASVTEHIEQCIDKLDDFSVQFSDSGLTANDYLAVERLLQILIESAIGFAKQWVKLLNKPIPSNAYDAFMVLNDCQLITKDELQQWKSMIGLRNVLVHDYLNVNTEVIDKVIM